MNSQKLEEVTCSRNTMYLGATLRKISTCLVGNRIRIATAKAATVQFLAKQASSSYASLLSSPETLSNGSGLSRSSA